jgi:hypothetical protein
MLKKRTNDNSQLSREEVDDLESSQSEAGHWQKASENELKERRILKIKRSSDDSNKSSSNAFAALGNAFLNATSAINPFKGFSALAPSSAATFGSSDGGSHSVVVAGTYMSVM